MQTKNDFGTFGMMLKRDNSFKTKKKSKNLHKICTDTVLNRSMAQTTSTLTPT